MSKLNNCICSFIILFLLSSCIGGRSRPSNFYTPIPISNENFIVKNKRKLNIAVGRVYVAGYLDRPEIVTLKEHNTDLSISNFNRWAEPLTGSLQRIISINIGSYLKNSEAKYMNTYNKSFDYLILTEINRLEGRFNDKVILEAKYLIIDNTGKTVLSENITLEEPIGEENYTELVNIESGLISKFSMEIAKKLGRL